ncbi:hypothetical protein KM043_003759 [Ampulex compressa]|nr:hypothetical protein KM043_003759 [Ampulex compressa]
MVNVRASRPEAKSRRAKPTLGFEFLGNGPYRNPVSRRDVDIGRRRRGMPKPRRHPATRSALLALYPWRREGREAENKERRERLAKRPSAESTRSNGLREAMRGIATRDRTAVRVIGIVLRSDSKA